MLFRDRPLLVDGIDEHLYLSRPVLERRVLEPFESGRNVLLLGEGGAGKSTLLRWAASRLKAAGRQAVIVNAAVASDAASLLELVADALEVPATTQGTTAVGGPARLLAAATALGETEPAWILLDGLSDPAVAFDVFGRLRDELWAAGHAWCVAVRPRDSGPLRTPPADAFWGSVVEIPPLNPGEVLALLELGLGADDARAAGELLAAGDGAYPRRIIRSVQGSEAEEGGDHTSDLALRLAAQLQARPPSQVLALAELRDLGRPAGAWDETLLEHLGWTRPYAQRILSSLEDAGVLRSLPERSDRPGRPRKLYEINPNMPNPT